MSHNMATGYEKCESSGNCGNTRSNGGHLCPVYRICKSWIGVHIGIAFHSQLHIQYFFVIYDSLDEALVMESNDSIDKGEIVHPGRDTVIPSPEFTEDSLFLWCQVYSFHGIKIIIYAELLFYRNNCYICNRDG